MLIKFIYVNQVILWIWQGCTNTLRYHSAQISNDGSRCCFRTKSQHMALACGATTEEHHA